MKKVALLAIVTAVLVLPLGCDKNKAKFREAQKVVEAYFEVYEARNVDSTYSYLCDKSYHLQAPDGNAVQFAARPDLETFKTYFNQTPQVAILTITPRQDLSNLDADLLVFEVSGRSMVEDMKVISFLAFVGPNSAGDWSVMLPVSSAPQQPPVPETPAPPE